MRTLLIDNYDSYTYNLFQLIAEVNGVVPVVVANDLDEARLDLSAFDNVVISPGPGRPTRARDFGIAAAVIARTEIPLLGVCLGHQGIAAGEGGEVVPAPAARHGHLTRVTHAGGALFRGIPGDFTAVRYHSLCVRQPLPATLATTAWAEDGVIMGLRHRTRPLWGVQFHPESVATEFGRTLLANFRDLTVDHHARQPRSRITVHAADHPTGTGAGGAAATANGGPVDPARVARSRRHPAASATVDCRLHVRVLDVAVDTEAAFTALFARSPRAFWLDSAHIEPGLSRFSYLGDGAGPLAEFVTYRVGQGHVEVQAGNRPPQRVTGDVFDYLRRRLRRRVTGPPDLPFDFCCGYVGYLGYELKADCGSPNRHRAPTPEACWMFADRMLVVDHEVGRTYVLALDDGSAAGLSGTLGWLGATIALLRSLPVAENRAPRRPASITDPAAVEPWLVRDRDRYLADIAFCKSQLLAGESYEICLTNAAWLPATGDGYDFYRELRRRNPAPYAAYLRLDGVQVACSSPERFLRVDRDGVVEAKPIKGTAPRGRTPDEDARLRHLLATSAKDRAENLMIVDLLRNDLGRVCQVGSVHVPRLMAVETYATVHQLVSTVRGRLRGDLDVLDCVRACFPGGSMTGAPKLRTMEIIDSLETTARGVYSGAIGYLACNGTADLNIVIRTAVLVDDQWHVGAGGAIVLDSDPAGEYDEMLLKAAATLRAHPVLSAPSTTALVPGPGRTPTIRPEMGRSV